MSPWRFLDTGPGRGAWNMAVDEALLEGVGSGGPVLRVYTWAPPAVSFGYGQHPWREVDLEKCRAAGVEVVRRLTGGRAVLHWEELTYSAICPEDDPQCGGPIGYTYRRLGEALVEGLRLFGVDAALERGQPRSPRPRATGLSEPCFSSLARWEVKCGGRKLIGSAQRRVRGAILQHGSLLTGGRHRRLLELRPEGGEGFGRLDEGSTSLDQWCGGSVDLGRLAGCLAEGFGRSLGVALRSGHLSRAEEARAAELMELQYGDPAWNRAVAN
ncbi:MAG: lipoate--protein ligase family protein [Candidatus Handelsmanbacteria bacterium]|nr:lipoate--protein ligase family protein [Candidatus Handelsmanbacteria bacterium]